MGEEAHVCVLLNVLVFGMGGEQGHLVQTHRLDTEQLQKALQITMCGIPRVVQCGNCGWAYNVHYNLLY